MFRNTKIQINSPEHSKAFQEAVFAAGGNWSGWEDGLVVIRHKDKPFLYVDEDMYITHQFEDYGYFSRHKNKEITFPEPQQGHPHIDLMSQYVEDAKTTDRPWELWELQHENRIDWLPMPANSMFHSFSTYRRKPENKLIHGVEVPDISFVPECNTEYYTPSITHSKLYSDDFYCRGCMLTKRRIELGLCYPHTEEGKQAAIIHAQAMLGIVGE